MPNPTEEINMVSREKMENQVENTDRELWREKEGDYYAPSIHITAQGGIGIDVGGQVYVKPLRAWHKLATEAQSSPISRDHRVEAERLADKFISETSGECDPVPYREKMIEAFDTALQAATDAGCARADRLRGTLKLLRANASLTAHQYQIITESLSDDAEQS